MKKLYTLSLILLISGISFAQNVITNGGFETWTEGTPDGWLITLGTNGGSVTQETTIVYEGQSSVKLTAPTGTGNNRVGFTDFAVTPGTTYTLTYWYYDQDNNARFRHWASFRTATAALPNNQQVPEFQPSTYNENTNGWQQVTVSGVAPVDAEIMRLDFRVFQQANDAAGGSVYVDNVAFGTNLSVNKNAIAGLKVYPNPVVDGTLYISTQANAERTIQIYDILGKQVVNKVTSNEAINVSNLNAGVYIVKITEEGKTASRKLVIN